MTEQLLTVETRIATEGNWVTPVRDALADVTADEASWKGGGDSDEEERSIREIVRHMAVWADWSTRLLTTGEDADVTDWPDESANWETERAELFAALDRFRSAIAGLDTTDALLAPSSPELPGYSRFLAVSSILAHNTYHAGQIVAILREIRRRSSSNSSA